VSQSSHKTIIWAAVFMVLFFLAPLIDILLRPGAIIRRPSFDAGLVHAGDLIRHRFLVQNFHLKPARVVQVFNGCGCSRAEMSVNEIRPLRSAHLTVEVDTRGMKDRKTAAATITFEDAASVTAVVAFTAEEPTSNSSKEAKQ